ncbi:hypothetical protein DRO69_08170 [Candidatus Bathyarchaeota archaeon]|nr:MAG: hypothetical protein DRO69_08170 [Candidatus Bathyarchaeota archaeon]
MNMINIKSERTIAIATLALIVYTLALALTGQVMSTIQTNRTISNAGAVKAIGVGVYWNSDGTSIVTSINWGILEPGSSANRTCYIKNEGNSASTLSMNTTNWNPSNASDYISLSWDYDGQLVNPDEVIPVVLTLSISSSVEGITSFSFDIIIAGSG